MTFLNISAAGVSLIKSSEGFAAHVYSDNGVPAIGYGHRLLPHESYPDGITEAQASALLMRDVGHFEQMLRPLVPNDCKQGQLDALVDFCYNVQNQPRAVKELLAHGWNNVPSQLPRWCHELKNGEWVVNNGLRARRLREVSLWEQA